MKPPIVICHMFTFIITVLIRKLAFYATPEARNRLPKQEVTIKTTTILPQVPFITQYHTLFKSIGRASLLHAHIVSRKLDILGQIQDHPTGLKF